MSLFCFTGTKRACTARRTQDPGLAAAARAPHHAWRRAGCAVDTYRVRSAVCEVGKAERACLRPLVAFLPQHIRYSLEGLGHGLCGWAATREKRSVRTLREQGPGCNHVLRVCTWRRSAMLGALGLKSAGTTCALSPFAFCRGQRRTGGRRARAAGARGQEACSAPAAHRRER
jgi:hypothetical protein